MSNCYCSVASVASLVSPIAQGVVNPPLPLCLFIDATAFPNPHFHQVQPKPAFSPWIAAPLLQIFSFISNPFKWSFARPTPPGFGSGKFYSVLKIVPPTDHSTAHSIKMDVAPPVLPFFIWGYHLTLGFGTTETFSLRPWTFLCGFLRALVVDTLALGGLLSPLLCKSGLHVPPPSQVNFLELDQSFGRFPPYGNLKVQASIWHPFAGGLGSQPQFTTITYSTAWSFRF